MPLRHTCPRRFSVSAGSRSYQHAAVLTEQKQNLWQYPEIHSSRHFHHRRCHDPRVVHSSTAPLQSRGLFGLKRCTDGMDTNVCVGAMLHPGGSRHYAYWCPKKVMYLRPDVETATAVVLLSLCAINFSCACSWNLGSTSSKSHMGATRVLLTKISEAGPSNLRRVVS